MSAFQETLQGDDWKIQLRDEIITVFTGNTQAKQNAYWQIGYHYTCSAPASLYKYYPDEDIRLDSIKSNKMWYSAPCNFNDVFDCEISVDDAAIFNCTLQMAPENMKIRTGSHAWKEIKRTIGQEIKSFRSTFETMKSTMGISCLSESDESLLMWAHYANNHRGMCVEYDLLKINQQLNFTPIPIVYSEDRVFFNTLNPDSAENDSVALFIQSITSKSKEWSYEREWRIIRDDVACGDSWDAEKKGALLDMVYPSSIILGCAAEEEFGKAVKEYCESNRIPLYKMQKDKSQYKLNKVPVLEFDS